jgi:hypothetical protein
MSGGCAKACPRREDGEPGGGEAQEGIGRCSRLNPVGDATDPGAEQALKAGKGAWRSAGNRRVACRNQRHEGTGRRRGGTAASGGNPLESKPWTWLRGETNPQGRWRRKPSRTCETSWTERCGTREPRISGRRRLTSRRGKQPQGRSFVDLQRRSEHELAALCRGAKAHGRMNPFRKEWGTAHEGRPSADRKRATSTGAENPMSPLVARIQYSAGLATP